MKRLKPILYEIICCVGQKPYAYKLYNENGITATTERPEYNPLETTILKSHGVCPDCLPIIYNKNGMIYKLK